MKERWKRMREGLEEDEGVLRALSPLNLPNAILTLSRNAGYGPKPQDP